VGTGLGATLESVASKTKRLASGCAHKQLAKMSKEDTVKERITHMPFKALVFVEQMERLIFRPLNLAFTVLPVIAN